MNRDGRALKYASEDLKADKKVVLAAVKQYGWALKHASKDLKADPEVLGAAKQNGLGLRGGGRHPAEVRRRRAFNAKHRR